MILTVSLYGALFALLFDLGHPNLVFLFNALTALLSAGVLFAVRFPRGALARAEGSVCRMYIYVDRALRDGILLSCSVNGFTGS
jgi:hypothetical protein